VTEIVQEAPPLIMTPDTVIVLPVVTINPPPLLINPLGVATVSPAGNASTKLTPVKLIAGFGLVSENVKLVVVFRSICAAPKAFEMRGGLAGTMPAPEPVMSTA
jgi:hypothetical protein